MHQDDVDEDMYEEELGDLCADELFSTNGEDIPSPDLPPRIHDPGRLSHVAEWRDKSVSPAATGLTQDGEGSVGREVDWGWPNSVEISPSPAESNQGPSAEEFVEKLRFAAPQLVEMFKQLHVGKNEILSTFCEEAVQVRAEEDERVKGLDLRHGPEPTQQVARSRRSDVESPFLPTPPLLAQVPQSTTAAELVLEIQVKFRLLPVLTLLSIPQPTKDNVLQATAHVNATYSIIRSAPSTPRTKALLGRTAFYRGACWLAQARISGGFWMDAGAERWFVQCADDCAGVFLEAQWATQWLKGKEKESEAGSREDEEVSPSVWRRPTSSSSSFDGLWESARRAVRGMMSTGDEGRKNPTSDVLHTFPGTAAPSPEPSSSLRPGRIPTFSSSAGTIPSTEHNRNDLQWSKSRPFGKGDMLQSPGRVATESDDPYAPLSETGRKVRIRKTESSDGSCSDRSPPGGSRLATGSLPRQSDPSLPGSWLEPEEEDWDDVEAEVKAAKEQVGTDGYLAGVKPTTESSSAHAGAAQQAVLTRHQLLYRSGESLTHAQSLSLSPSLAEDPVSDMPQILQKNVSKALRMRSLEGISTGREVPGVVARAGAGKRAYRAPLNEPRSVRQRAKSA